MIKFLAWYAVGSIGLIIVSFIYLVIYAAIKLPDNKNKAEYDRATDYVMDTAEKKVLSKIPDGLRYSEGFVGIIAFIFRLLATPLLVMALLLYAIREIDAYEKPKEESA